MSRASGSAFRPLLRKITGLRSQGSGWGMQGYRRSLKEPWDLLLRYAFRSQSSGWGMQGYRPSPKEPWDLI